MPPHDQPDGRLPLTDIESTVAERIARRIHAELRELLSLLPAEVLGGTALSRHLDVHRSTCERVVAAASRREADASLLARIPGAEGLRLFLDGLRRAGFEEKRLAGAETAVEEYEAFLQEVAGSQARLKTRLAISHQEEGVPGWYDPYLYHREGLFEAAAAITGRSSETQLTLCAYRRCPRDPAGFVEAVFVSGYFGHRAEAGALPLLLVSGPTDLDEEGGDQNDRFRTTEASEVEGRSPDTILREFTTRPLPTTTSRQRESGMLHTFVDPDRSLGGRAFDVVLAYRARSPIPEIPRGETVPFTYVNLLHYPARRLFQELYLHRELIGEGLPRMAHGMMPPPGMTGDRWAFRLGHPPGVVRMDSLPQDAATERCPRHEEILVEVFERVGWPLEELVGFRCEVPCPIWQIGYQFSFDYPSAEG